MIKTKGAVGKCFIRNVHKPNRHQNAAKKQISRPRPRRALRRDFLERCLSNIVSCAFYRFGLLRTFTILLTAIIA